MLIEFVVGGIMIGCEPRDIGFLFFLAHVGLISLCLVLVRISVRFVSKTESIRFAGIPFLVALVSGFVSLFLLVDRMVSKVETTCGYLRDSDTMLLFMGYSNLPMLLSLFIPLWFAYAWQGERSIRFFDRLSKR